MTPISQKIGALQSLVRGYQEHGLFSHCFVETGRFSDGYARASFSTLPGGYDLFDLSSLTKAFVTTPLVFDEIGSELKRSLTFRDFAGAIGLSEDSPLLSLTVSSLLGHRSGLPAWRNFWLVPRDDGTWDFPAHQLSSEDSVSHILRVLTRSGLPLGSETFSYSDLGFLLLGVGLRSRLKRSLDKSANIIFGSASADPATFLGFRPQESLATNKAIPTSFCALRGRELRGEVHDENCYALGGVTGHAGLFGTGPGVMSFLRKFVQSELGSRLIVGNARLRHEHAGDDGLMGWRQGNGITASLFGGGQAIGHYGFTGTGFWIVPNANGQAETYCVVLTNRIKSGRMSAAINEFRKSVHKICWEIVSQ